MEIKHTAMAGTLESSDITVEIKPNPENEIGIILESSVEKNNLVIRSRRLLRILLKR
ncbi:hypothetical protein GCM10020331_006280 [Ectobacillus funiculus]